MANNGIRVARLSMLEAKLSRATHKIQRLEGREKIHCHVAKLHNHAKELLQQARNDELSYGVLFSTLQELKEKISDVMKRLEQNAKKNTSAYECLSTANSHVTELLTAISYCN